MKTLQQHNIFDLVLSKGFEITEMVDIKLLTTRRGCVRFGEPTTILAIFMEIKPHEKSLWRNPLSDVISKPGYGVTWARVRSSLPW
jgi:hypothetical protein